MSTQLLSKTFEDRKLWTSLIFICQESELTQWNVPTKKNQQFRNLCSVHSAYFLLMKNTPDGNLFGTATSVAQLKCFLPPTRCNPLFIPRIWGAELNQGVRLQCYMAVCVRKPGIMK